MAKKLPGHLNAEALKREAARIAQTPHGWLVFDPIPVETLAAPSRLVEPNGVPAAGPCPFHGATLALARDRSAKPKPGRRKSRTPWPATRAFRPRRGGRAERTRAG